MIGNQQVSDVEIGWLAGSFDADGCVSMHMQQTKRGEVQCRAEIAWTNTNWIFLDKVMSLCSRLGVNLCVQEKTRSKSYWSRAWNVRTGKLSKAKVLLEAMLPYLTVKAERAKLALDFINRRLSFIGDGKIHPYNDKDYAYFIKFRKLNKRPQPPETSSTIETPVFRREGSRVDPKKDRSARILKAA